MLTVVVLCLIVVEPILVRSKRTKPLKTKQRISKHDRCPQNMTAVILARNTFACALVLPKATRPLVT
jgi:hypothetical protein